MILGTGRGGTTIFLEMLGEHPDLAWFSNFTNYAKKEAFYPLAALSRIRDCPVLGDALPYHSRFRPKPREANDLYRTLSRGVFNQPRLLEAMDADENQVRYWRKAVKAHLRWHGKPRFLNKHTGFPRTDYFGRIFPDAKFIHVVRDGRAVANSYMNVPFWDGTVEGCWHWGPMEPAYKDEFESSGREPIVLAGILWKTLIKYIDTALVRVPKDQQIEVNYSQFSGDPEGVMKMILDYTGLPHRSKFQKRIRKMKVHNADVKWKEDLSTKQKELLMNTIGNELEEHGFLTQ